MRIDSIRFVLAAAAVTAAPGCVLYARVPLRAQEAGWSAQAGYSGQPPDVRVECVGTEPCAPPATGGEASGVVVVEHTGAVVTSSDVAASGTVEVAGGASAGGTSTGGTSTGGAVWVVEESGPGSGTVVVSGDGAGGYGYPAGAGYESGASAGAVVVSEAGAGEVSGSPWSTAAGASASGTASVAAAGPVGIASAVGVTGQGRGLLAIAGEGVTIDGSIAALELLRPLASSSFEASARVGGDASISVDATLAHDALPAAGGSTSVVLRVAGGTAPSTVPPMRVHLVIDASTSMESTWGNLQQAALRLVGRLRPQDELQIVVYSSNAREVLAPVRVGDGSAARRVIRNLRPGGQTHIEAGLRIAYRAVRPHGSIVVLLSDGVPNGGLSTPDELGSLAAEASARGAVTTAIGIGWDFHPGVLRAIAERGHGHFRIAPRIDELGAILEAELAARGLVTARDVEVSLALGPGVRVGELPEGVVADGGRVRIALPSVAAGEEKVIVVPVEVPPGADARSVARVGATWTPLATGSVRHADKPLSVAVAPQPVLAGAALASLDADLAAALTLAADAVTNGDAGAAAAALRAHAERARVHLRVRAHAGLEARVTHVLTIATALERLVPSASWHDRRATGASMLSFALRF